MSWEHFFHRGLFFKARLSKNQEVGQVDSMVRSCFRNMPGILALPEKKPWNLYDCPRVWQLIISEDLRPHNILSTFFRYDVWRASEKDTLLFGGIFHVNWKVSPLAQTTENIKLDINILIQLSYICLFTITFFGEGGRRVSRIFIKKPWVYLLQVNFIFTLGAIGEDIHWNFGPGSNFFEPWLLNVYLLELKAFPKTTKI